MDINIADLAKDGIRHLTPYQPGKPLEELERELGITSAIKLASNENPLGPSPRAIKAIEESLNKLHFYPDGSGYTLKRALSKFLGVHSNQITLGNGSENVLEIIIKTFLNASDEAIISEYCFATIPIILKSLDANIVRIPEINFKPDLVKMLASIHHKTRLVFIVNPNNPTGTYLNSDELKNFLSLVPKHVIVILDEAYYEFATNKDYPQTLSWLEQFPNLIITRTFSKAYGLAGIRLGYGVASKEISEMLNRARLPFNVNLLAEIAGVAALDDKEFLARTMQMNQAGMEQLILGLKKLELEFIPSVCNFISIKLNVSAQHIYDQLLYQGVIVRPLTAYQMPNYIRVTVGTELQNKLFLEALETVLEDN